MWRSLLLGAVILASCTDGESPDGDGGGGSNPGNGGSASGGSPGQGGDGAGATGGSPGQGGDAQGGDGQGGDAPLCGDAGPQSTRLRIISQCDQPIWIQASENVPMPATKLEPGDCFDAPVPDAALSATRFWPKLGCNEQGEDCKIGQSVAPCPQGGCQPPIDSKFEATWADPVNCPTSGGDANCVTWYNASQVDGYTLPFSIRPTGPGSDAPGCVVSECGDLDLSECPSAEDLSQGGEFPAYDAVDLRVLDPDDPSKVLGCLSPCKKLNYPAPWGHGMAENISPAVEFCCPTPPISPEQCSSGPVVETDFVNRLQDMCPSVYSYAYDDADGLHTCPAQTQFEVVFCPE